MTGCLRRRASVFFIAACAGRAHAVPMKRRPGLPTAFLLAGVMAAGGLAGARAQEQPAVTEVGASAAPLYSATQLDQLLGPIALYPDPLIAVMLPAATASGDIVSAASFLAAHGNPNLASHEPWSDSVKALAHYPVVVEWMAQNLIWTQALGAAFVDQPDDVMQSIQRLRAKAMAAGTLASTPQQQVVEEDGLVEILPAEADVIYVPVYNPDIVYVGGYFDGPFLSFGAPYPAGIWLDYGFDWRQRILWVGSRRFTHDSRGWQVPNLGANNGHRWSPPADRPGAGPFATRPRASVVRPNPMPGTDLSFRSDSRPAPAGNPISAPRPRPTLPPAARGAGPASNDVRPAIVTAPPPAASVLYYDMRGGAPGNGQSKPAVPPAKGSNPAPHPTSSSAGKEGGSTRSSPKESVPARSSPPDGGKEADTDQSQQGKR